MIILLLFLATWMFFGIKGGMLGGLFIALAQLGGWYAGRAIAALCIGMWIMYRTHKMMREYDDNIYS